MSQKGGLGVMDATLIIMKKLTNVGADDSLEVSIDQQLVKITIVSIVSMVKLDVKIDEGNTGIIIYKRERKMLFQQST